MSMCIEMIAMAAGASAETAATVATVAQVIGTLYTAGAGYASANAAASVAEQNARLSEQKGMATMQKAGWEERRIRAGSKKLQGQQRSLLAASGVDVNTGSALDVQADTAYQAAEDVAMTHYNAELQKWGFDIEAANYKAQAASAKQQATSALIGGVIGAGSSILTGGSQFGSKWSSWTQKPNVYQPSGYVMRGVR